jgi:hypothetical protein
MAQATRFGLEVAKVGALPILGQNLIKVKRSFRKRWDLKECNSPHPPGPVYFPADLFQTFNDIISIILLLYYSLCTQRIQLQDGRSSFQSRKHRGGE